MSNETTCCTCGSPVRVIGDVTKSYVPIHAHDRSFMRSPVERDKLQDLNIELQHTCAELARRLRVAKEALEYYADGECGPYGDGGIKAGQALKEIDTK